MILLRLQRVCRELEVPEDLVYYFGLFLLLERRRDCGGGGLGRRRRGERDGCDDDGDLVIVRKLQDFESPYFAQKSPSRRLVLRKA